MLILAEIQCHGNFYERLRINLDKKVFRRAAISMVIPNGV